MGIITNETTNAPESRRVQRCPELSPVATAGGYCRLEHVLVLRVQVLVKAVETMGLEPTTPCLQSVGGGFTGVSSCHLRRLDLLLRH